MAASRPMQIVLIGLAGAAGSILRYLSGRLALRVWGMGFPYGTLLVNAMGCFAMGWLMTIDPASKVLTPLLRTTLATGLLGGFTTYSAFNWETMGYFHTGRPGMGLLNITTTVLVCLATGTTGWWIGSVGHTR